MVLQRKKPIAIWGSGTQGENFCIQLKDKSGLMLAKQKAIVDMDEKWNIALPPMEANRNLTLTLISETNQVIYDDILIGEVWIAGGQSNMEYFLFYDAERKIELDREENPDIRFWDAPKESYEGEAEDYDFSEFGFWRRCIKEEKEWFSSVGYYYAIMMQEQLQVPIGIVGCNWGGTPACAWIGEDYLTASEGRIWLEEYKENNQGVSEQIYKECYLKISSNIFNHPFPREDSLILYPGLTREQQLVSAEYQKRELQKMKPEVAHVLSFVGPCHPWRPCGLYHTMLKKIVPYSCRGILWYQGESDHKHPDIYADVMSALIQNWRDLWADELPFLLVQLAPFYKWFTESGENYPVIRQQQELVSKLVPQTYLCSNSDAGMRWDIHPKHKRPVGTRLARLALAHVYKTGILGDAPELDDIHVNDSEIRIRFKHATGLYLKDEKGEKCKKGVVQALVINEESCEGHIEGSELVIERTAKLSENDEISIAFAMSDYYEVNLYNEVDVPGIPFFIREKSVL